jgi:hypothetical protein
MRVALTWHYSQDQSVVALLDGNRAPMTADSFTVGHGVTASGLWPFRYRSPAHTANGVVSYRYPPRGFFSTTISSRQLTNVGGCMASAQWVS